MADISVISMKGSNGWTCTVQVTEPNGQTRHSVNVTQQEYDQLTGGKTTTPEELVRRSFEFLLEREPKEHILRQFNLPAIQRYFPEYPVEIKKRFPA